MIAELVAEARVDLIVGEVRERLERVDRRMAAEANATARALLRREDPAEAIQRAFVERRVMLEAAAEAADERRLRRAVRAVQQDQLVRPAVLHERAQDPIRRVLDHLLAEQSILAVCPWRVEQLEASDLAPRIADLLRAVVVEAV